MSDYLPKFHAGVPFTLTAAEDVSGGLLVAVDSAGAVVVAGATAEVVGVASRDAAEGETVGVYPLGAVHRLEAAGEIAAGAVVTAAAAGRVGVGGSTRVGVALSAAAAEGDVIDVVTR